MKNGHRLQQPPGWGSNGSERGIEPSYEKGSSASHSKTRWVEGDRNPEASRLFARRASPGCCASKEARDANSERSCRNPWTPISKPRAFSSRTIPGSAGDDPPRVNDDRN